MVPDANGPTEDAFAERLRELVNEAHANGVDVEGGWMDRKDSTAEPDWGIEIYEVTKRRRHTFDG